jgi:SAM-dependent methyltransferase
MIDNRLIEETKKDRNYFKKLQEGYNLNADLFALALVQNKKKVLSLGCGAGREVKELIKKDCSVTAVDIDKEMIESSQKIEKKANYILGDFTNKEILKKIDSDFDYILLLFNTINYLKKEEKSNLIKNCFLKLNSQGKIIIVTADLACSFRYLLSNLKHRRGYYFLKKEYKIWEKISLENKKSFEIINVGKGRLILIGRK